MKRRRRPRCIITLAAEVTIIRPRVIRIPAVLVAAVRKPIARAADDGDEGESSPSPAGYMSSAMNLFNRPTRSSIVYSSEHLTGR